jgi:hypothetical protein
MCSVSVPSTVHDYFDRIRRHCIWRSSDIHERTKPIVTWKKCTKPKRKGVWESSTSKVKTRHYSLNTSTSFTIRTFPRLTKFGTHTILMEKSLMRLRRKDLSDEKMCLSYLTSLEGLHLVRCGMVPQFSSGLMIGMITFFNKSFQDFTLLPRIKTF